MVATPAAIDRGRPEWLETLAGQASALLAALAIAVLAGAAIIIGYGESPLAVYGAILQYAFQDVDSFGFVLAIATPLIFSALAISICFKAGLFNIGVEGQYLVGMVAAAWAALNLDFLPGPILMWGVLLAGAIGGMLWALVPAVLKVATGAHEVVTTIMMNGIAISFLAWALNGPLKFTDAPPGQNVDLRTDPFPQNALVPDLGHAFGMRPSVHLSWMLPLGIALAVLVWFLVKRTRLGYEARAVGSSAGSAQASGISIGKVQIQLFLISGALAGLTGMHQILGDRGYLPQNYITQLGFTGIAVAFLGQNNPAGIVFAAVIWGILSRGETALQIETEVPREFVIILQAILILTVVVTYQVARRRLQRRSLRREGLAERRAEEIAAAEDA